jgi:DNA topoisomerase I
MAAPRRSATPEAEHTHPRLAGLVAGRGGYRRLVDEPPAGLTRVDPAVPGLTRRRHGRGWVYLDVDGKRIVDPEEIARIKTLVIPPAWEDVWICPDPDGHVQAVGVDAAGRRQYRYHDEWRRARDRDKHDRVLCLGRRLPDLRADVVERLEEAGLGRERVLAAGVRMLDHGVFRSGGEEYAPGDDDDDGTFGLATLRREHVSRHRGAIRFTYPAKGGQERAFALRDPLLHAIVGSLLRRRGGGDELLVYHEGRLWHDVRAEDLNVAVKDLAGSEHTCKDLRTWNATVRAAVAIAAALPRSGVPAAQRARARIVAKAMREVAEHLGNTPAVARASYVDPRVVERFEHGRTLGTGLPPMNGTADDAARGELDRAVAALIDDSG